MLYKNQDVFCKCAFSIHLFGRINNLMQVMPFIFA